MNRIPLSAFALFGLAALVIAGSMSVFTVDERERAIVLQLGQPVGDIQQPGLHFKLPLVQEVRRFDSRILSVDPQPSQIVISSGRAGTARKPPETAPVRQDAPEADEGAALADEITSGEPIIVDTFARYRITDPLKFMKTLRTVDAASQRIENIMNDATRSVLGRSTMRGLLSPERARLMEEIRNQVNAKIEADHLGITIIDIRIVRADLTPELRQSTVTRMISELRERATETRAQGEERALEIRATAEKERTVILAQADRDAKAIKGDGERQAIGITAASFGKDKDFYTFTRTLEAYRNTLANEDTRLILSPDDAFLRYLKQGD